MAEAVGGLAPITEKEVKTRAKEFISVHHERTEPGLDEIAAKKRSIIVELDPPKKLSFDKFLSAVAELKEAGIDALTLADNSLATPRISNVACGALSSGGSICVHLSILRAVTVTLSAYSHI